MPCSKRGEIRVGASLNFIYIGGGRVPALVPGYTANATLEHEEQLLK